MYTPETLDTAARNYIEDVLREAHPRCRFQINHHGSGKVSIDVFHGKKHLSNYQVPDGWKEQAARSQRIRERIESTY